MRIRILEKDLRFYVGLVEVKEKLTAAINDFLLPIRRRKEELEADSGYVEQIIYEGTMRTSIIADETLMMMKKAMGLTGVWNKISRKGRKRMEKLQKAAAAADGNQ